ncbi:MAG: class I SAM-dependent methyltransferase [Deltaproteobacteria bacterium]|nr:class I SAM-dependent methyltransferase [Deltaproteobacteria bacterium]MBW2256959.1 class I SAM-dependent methyltransferase [Deltaproteobacteria bacterium]
MLGLVDKLDRIFYPTQGSCWDDDLLRQVILERLRPGDVVLDLGAGTGRVIQMDFRGHAARLCGVDPDERVLENPCLDDARVGVGEAIPYEDATFDGVFSDNVLEHLEEPDKVFREVARVLKPGGWFVVKTPNRFHYVPLIAQVTPHRFHQLVNRLRGRPMDDTFPTRYRANSRGALRRIALRTGLHLDSVRMVEGRPEYLRLTTPTYLMGIAYERLVNATPHLERLRVVLVGILTKPG